MGIQPALATGNFGIKHSNAKVGVAQILSRLNYPAAASHIRRISMPTDKSGKLIPPRKLHSTCWGFLCPAETPEGQSVGIVKNLACLAHITIPSHPAGVHDMIQPFLIPLSLHTTSALHPLVSTVSSATSAHSSVESVKPMVYTQQSGSNYDTAYGGLLSSRLFRTKPWAASSSTAPATGSGSGSGSAPAPATRLRNVQVTLGTAGLYANRVKVFVNGAWVGVTLQPMELYAMLQRNKECGIVNVYTGIVFDYKLLEIRICTEGGRVMRPVLRVHHHCRLWLTSEIVDRVASRDLMWDDLLVTTHLPHAVLEYIDADEQSGALIATNPSELDESQCLLRRYTHCE
jgi:DNA-directed RNA polymerase beta subunit